MKIRTGPSAGETFEVVDPMIVGREGADITIGDPQISRRHAELRPVDDGVEVEDLGSTNGTFINETRVNGTQVARDGDVIRVGESEIDVDAPVEAASQGFGGTVVAPRSGATVMAAAAGRGTEKEPPAEEPAKEPEPSAPEPKAPAASATPQAQPEQTSPLPGSSPEPQPPGGTPAYTPPPGAAPYTPPPGAAPYTPPGAAQPPPGQGYTPPPGGGYTPPPPGPQTPPPGGAPYQQQPYSTGPGKSYRGPNPKKAGDNTALIIGLVVGGVVLLILLVLVLVAAS